MGTDIHLYIERKTASGTWERVRPTPWRCTWCDGTGKGSRSGDDCHNCKGAGTTTKEYRERNYNLFGMLANVRNGYGFAGTDTGDGFVPLSSTRGLPPDTSLKDSGEGVEYEDRAFVWLGDHSFSHATLAEVLAYDYDRTTIHRGVVSAAEYGAWVDAGRRGAPKEYCSAVTGPNIRNISQQEMDRRIREGCTSDARYHTQVEWESTYRESAGTDWFNFLEACKPLGDPNDVRFVFGFDS